MMKIVTAGQMMKIDRDCIASGTLGSVLMENAGRAVAEVIIKNTGDVSGKKVVILAGPGNNGGDGLVVARYLWGQGAEVTLYLFGTKRENDDNLDAVTDRDIKCIEVADENGLNGFYDTVKTTAILVDSLFGTGNNRPISGAYKVALETARAAAQENSGMYIYAVDLPSGLNADTGAVDEACLQVDETITLAAPKVGLFQYPGAEKAGRITIVDIGIPASLFADIELELNTSERVKTRLPKRPVGANKGTFGKALVIAGSINYIGAAYLACSGAIRAGAGLVTLASPASLQPIIASKLAEATYLPLAESNKGVISAESVETIMSVVDGYDVVLIGCGLGQSQSTVEFVRTLLMKHGDALPSLVIDSDALNILSSVPEWWRQITENAILTPHPGEMARLTDSSVGEVQRNRLRIAEESAKTWGKTIALKGAYTVIASPGVPTVVNPAANPGLASAGTGDVLAGVIAGMLAQGLQPAVAASCGVYIHAEAGETVKTQLGDTGMTASDLLPVLPKTIKQVRESETG